MTWLGLPPFVSARPSPRCTPIRPKGSRIRHEHDQPSNKRFQRLPVIPVIRDPRGAGIVTAGEVIATGEYIASLQDDSGAISWPDGHADPWNHVECVMALAVAGEPDRAREIYTDIQHLREADGSYWTGWQFDHAVPFPAERSGWTAAAAVLAADVLSGATPGSCIFDQAGALPAGSFDPAAGGCPPANGQQPAWPAQRAPAHDAGGDGIAGG